MGFKPGNNANPKGRGSETEKKRKTAELLLSPLVQRAVNRIERSLEAEDRADHQWAVDLIASYSWTKPKQEVDLKSDGQKIGILYVGTPPKPE